MKILRVRHLLRLPTSRVLQHGASGTAPVGCADRSAAGADAFVSLCRCESVWSRRHFSGTVVYSAVYRRTAADFLQKLRLFNSHQVLQLRETPLCTGADRAVIQNNLAGAAIQRADMRSVYQAGFVTEKKLWSSLESVSFKEPLHW